MSSVIPRMQVLYPHHGRNVKQNSRQSKHALFFVKRAAADKFPQQGKGRDILHGILGGPMAVSGYIMAKNMKSDHELAGQILLISTLFCIVTMFVAIYILKSLSLI